MMYDILGLALVVLALPAFYIVCILIFGPIVYLKEKRRKKKRLQNVRMQEGRKN